MTTLPDDMRMTESEEEPNVIRFQPEDNGEETAAEAKLEVKNLRNEKRDNNGKS